MDNSSQLRGKALKTEVQQRHLAVDPRHCRPGPHQHKAQQLHTLSLYEGEIPICAGMKKRTQVTLDLCPVWENLARCAIQIEHSRFA